MKRITLIRALCLIGILCATTFVSSAFTRKFVNSLPAPTSSFGYSYCPGSGCGSGAITTNYGTCGITALPSQTITYSQSWRVQPAGGGTPYNLTGSSNFTVTNTSTGGTLTCPSSFCTYISGLTPGNYVLYVVCSVVSGSTSGACYAATITSPNMNFTIVDPTTTASASPSYYCPSSGACSLSAAITSGDPATFSWTASSGTSLTTYSGPSTSTTSAVTGLYSVTSTMTTSVGTCGSTVTVPVYAPTPVTPSIASVPGVCTGSSTMLTGTGTGSDFTSETYLGTGSGLHSMSNDISTMASGTGFVNFTGSPDLGDGFYEVPLGFNFNFYGVTYNTIFINVNGYITFGTPSMAGGSGSPISFPIADPAATVALFAQDMDNWAGGDIGYTSTGGHFYIIYNNVPDASYTYTYSGQIEIKDDNTINMLILGSSTAVYNTCTQGVQDLTTASNYYVGTRNGTTYSIPTSEERAFSFTTVPALYGYAWTTSGPGGLSSASGTPTTATAITAATTYDLAITDAFGCTTPTPATTTIGVNTYTWNGSFNDHWDNVNNWDCLDYPRHTYDNAYIPSGLTRYPTVYSTPPAIGSIFMTYASGAPRPSITINSGTNLEIHGDLQNEGTIDGAGSLLVNGSSTQNLSTHYVGNYINNLKFGSSATVVNILGAGAGSNATAIKTAIDFDMSATLTLNTNDSLTLISDTFENTARVDIIPTTGGTSNVTINGNMNVQQGIVGGRRAYRFFGHPFSTDLSNGLLQLETGINITGGPAGHLGDNSPPYCLTTTITNLTSAYHYVNAVAKSYYADDPGWVPFYQACATTAPDNYASGAGIRIMVRGALGEGLWTCSMTPSCYVPHAAKYVMAGPINKGNVNIHLDTSGSDTTVLGVVKYWRTYNLIGNPYPCPVNLSQVVARSIALGMLYQPYFWVWNPYLGSTGQYVHVNPSDASDPYYNPSYIIAGNTSFEVRSNPPVFYSSPEYLYFMETDKALTPSAMLLRTTGNNNTEQAHFTLKGPGGNDWDYFGVQFDPSANDNFERMGDVGKRGNQDFNFYSLSADGEQLASDRRPFTDNGIIPINISGTYSGHFKLSVSDLSVPVGKLLYLHNKADNSYTLVTQDMLYEFDYTGAEGMVDSHFELVMKPAQSGKAEAAFEFNATMTPNPATNKIAINFQSSGDDATEVSISDMSGVVLMTSAAEPTATGKVTLDIANLASGIYFVKITNGSNRIVQKLVKE